MIEPSVVEGNARKALARFRKKGVIAKIGDKVIDVEIVEGRARVDDEALYFTLRVTVDGVATEETAVRFALLATKKLDAFVDGWAMAVSGILKRVATYEPKALVFPEVTNAKDALGFAEKLLVAAEKQTAEAQDEVVEAALRIDDLKHTKPVAVNAELEAAIAAAPDNPAGYLVYGDWLLERNDPRGELTAAQQQGGGDGGDELLAKHRRYFIGNLGSEPNAVTLEWSLGWIKTACVNGNYDRGAPWGRKALFALMKLPSAKFLRSLEIRSMLFGFDRDDRRQLLSLRDAGERPLLQRLVIGDAKVYTGFAGEVGMLDGLYPNLEHFEVTSGEISLEGFDLPSVRTLIVRSSSLTTKNVRALAAASLPNLEHLHIELGLGLVGGKSRIKDLAPILNDKPALRDLRLCGVQYADALFAEIVKSPILKQLKRLDLSNGSLSGESVALLERQASKLRHLEAINLSGNRLTDGEVTRLAKTKLPLTLDYQKGELDRPEFEEDDED